MWRLYHFPLCPFSRKVRLLLSEKGIPFELDEVFPWAPHPAFCKLNPLARTPVLQNAASGIVLADSWAITEYIEEMAPEPTMLSGSAEQRAEVRRLIAWSSECFFSRITGSLLGSYAAHRLQKPAEAFSPHELMQTADGCLDGLDFLLDRRSWLAGVTMTLADLAAAAQVSVADYFGVVNWAGNQQAQTWYSVLKSRRSFQPLLADRVDGVIPPAHYSKIDT